ncbi:hypothetical protein PTKIN_Ptkin04bG0048100 [Pterospermum kingtungense]
MQESAPDQASGSGLSEELRQEEERADEEIYLTDDKQKVSELRESPICSSLIALYLQANYELISIPPHFFQRMAFLQVLDLSGTNIKSLPNSITKLVALKKLFLRSCQLFMELSPEVGKLKNLEELDLDETQIMDLPREIGKLLKLRHLTVSFYPVSHGKKKSKWNTLMDPGSISFLSQLTKLIIDVSPADKRWDDSGEAVVKEVSNSKTLRSLSLYLPKFQLLGNISLTYPSLSRFRFIVGHQKRKIISRVPHEVEAEFRKLDKCLKFVNGESIPIEIKGVLNYSTAFFLDYHATARNLSEFGIENMKKLKFCLLAECNKMKTVVDGEKHYERNEDDVLESLEYLRIYYMENLGSIWSGQNGYGCMSNLKFLGLHTCPQLSNIFSSTLLENFINLEEIILEDCPQVTSLVSDASVGPMMPGKIFLPRLKRLLLLYLPELVSISNGLFIAPKLESIGFYNCPKLKSISKKELSSKTLKIIKGECQWWEDLNWNETEWGNWPDYLMPIFSPIDGKIDLMTQLAENTDLFEAIIQKDGQQQDDEKLHEVSTEDHKSQFSEEKTTETLTKSTSSESILLSTSWLRTPNVLQVEPLISSIRNASLDIFQFLKFFHQHLLDELSLASVEDCLQKIKHVGHTNTSSVFKEAMMDPENRVGPSSEILVKIAESLCLRSNQEILLEAVALEKLKENAEQAEKTAEAELEFIDQMIALVTCMHDHLALVKQSQTYSPVPIPDFFCCPLSLELMTDPVTVASGQTYERAFIKKWFDLGLTVCPKTRKTLSHASLIPNYLAKKLIANWCESNNVTLPDPMKSMSLNQPYRLLVNPESGLPRDKRSFLHSRSSQPMLPESQSTGQSGKNLIITSCELHREGISTVHSCSTTEDSLPGIARYGKSHDIARILLNSSEDRSNLEQKDSEEFHKNQWSGNIYLRLSSFFMCNSFRELWFNSVRLYRGRLRVRCDNVNFFGFHTLVYSRLVEIDNILCKY